MLNTLANNTAGLDIIETIEWQRFSYKLNVMSKLCGIEYEETLCTDNLFINILYCDSTEFKEKSYVKIKDNNVNIYGRRINKNGHCAFNINVNELNLILFKTEGKTFVIPIKYDKNNITYYLRKTQYHI